jgi:hypothetical protein
VASLENERYDESRQIRLEQHSRFCWRITFDHPPLNIFGPETIPQLNEVITAFENDALVKVGVFDSAVEGFFLMHYDFLAKTEATTSLPPGPTGLQALPDMPARLSRAPVVSIVSIRGRATVVGSELVRASVLRVAKKLSCRNGRLVPAWCRVADRWHGCPALRAGDVLWKCCLGQTTSAVISPSFTAMSIVLCPTRSSTRLSMPLRCGLPRSINRQSQNQNIWSISPAYRPTRKLRLSGRHLLMPLAAPPAEPE